jgi:hypothetical protein
MHPNFNIRGQRINSNGNTLWGGGGTEICNNPGQQNTPNIISDGNGGIIATWEDGRNGGSDIYASKINANGILGGESYPLPVELSTFTASVSDSKVSLSWKTETEVNNYGFEVERKSGISNWNKIGFVTGKGNNNNNQSYSFIDENRNSGKYSYRLKQIDKNGKYAYSKIIEISIATPIKYELSQNYPNPFNPTTVIRYAVPFESNVNIRFYNSLGQCVRELNETSRKAGYYEGNFNASGLASGVYFYSIKAASTDGKNNFNSVKKMLMLK